MLIHAPSSAELPTLRSIELAAGSAFRELGMTAIADAEPPTLAPGGAGADGTNSGT
ncbi:hypothetical protein RM550_09255 [Streptomyces sp. DSM 41527]|uniref:Uncharacterized protein n=1 Tax=Streptomyces mooreae TaxID=3075523 RepID=A0ABU2T6P1_9ACTN|nr:hypothetical protein [Streptomyces sp. DSM 41527]MDT0455924.1 hypothetical protein [Streptomyces sp. DSM 41527]